jgi:hypothetical protein
MDIFTSAFSYIAAAFFLGGITLAILAFLTFQADRRISCQLKNLGSPGRLPKKIYHFADSQQNLQKTTLNAQPVDTNHHSEIGVK